MVRKKMYVHMNVEVDFGLCSRLEHAVVASDVYNRAGERLDHFVAEGGANEANRVAA